MPIYEFGEFKLDADEKQLVKDGQLVSIPPKAFDILSILVENAGHLFSKDELFKAVWPDSFVADSSLAQNIYILRKALGEGLGKSTFIETVPRRGYRFKAQVCVEDHIQTADTSVAVGQIPAEIPKTAVAKVRRPYSYALRTPVVVSLCLVFTGVLTGSYIASRSHSSNLKKSGATSRLEKVSSDQGRELARRQTEVPEAYSLYTRGLFFWNQRTEESTKRAIDHFQQAVTADPNFALAYSMLADSYNLVGYYRYNSILRQREAYTKAEEAITTALSLDSEIAEAHLALAFVKLNFRQDLGGAEKEYKRAISLNPGNAFAHQRYSTLLLVQGHLDSALAEMQTAHQLDPLSTRISTNLSTLLYYRRQFAEAEEVCRKALEMSPNDPVLNQQLGIIRLTAGNPSDALAIFRKARDIGGSDSDYVEGSGYAYAKTGRIAETRKMISEIEAAASRKDHYYRTPATLVLLYAATGDVEKALRFIEQKNDWDVIRMRPILEFDPLLDSFRSDERFKKMVSRRFGVKGLA